MRPGSVAVAAGDIDIGYADEAVYDLDEEMPMSADTRYMFDEATEEEARLCDHSVVLDPLTEQVLLHAG